MITSRIFLILFLFFPSLLFSQSWQSKGPYGGMTRSLVSGSNGQLFAGTSSGVYILNSNEQGWRSVNTGLTNRAIYSLTLKDGYLFAGTTNGVYVTVNNGTSWSFCGLSQATIRSLYFSGKELLAAGYTNVYRTTDYGNSWTTVYGITKYINCFQAFGQNIYAGGAGFFKSSDGGLNWHPASERFFPPSGPRVVKSMAVNGSSLLVVSNDSLYISNSDASSWKSQFFAMGSNISSMTVSGGSLFAGSSKGVYISKDLGLNWNSHSNGMYDSHVTSAGPEVYTLAFHDNKLYAGSSEGLYFLSNDSQTWSVAGLSNVFIYSLAVCDTNIFASARGGGVFRSSQNIGVWESANNGLPDQYIYSLACTGDKLFAGMQWGEVYISKDKGRSWTTTGFSQKTGKDFVRYMLSDKNKLYAAGVDISYTTDNGQTWVAGNRSLLGANPLCLAVNDKYLYAATGGAGVYRSTDDGQSWSATSLTRLFTESIAANGPEVFAGTDRTIFHSTDYGDTWKAVTIVTDFPHSNVNTIYYYKGYLLAGTDTGLYISRDNGRSWLPATKSLPNIKVFSICIFNSQLILGCEIFTGPGIWGIPAADILTGLDNEKASHKLDFKLEQNHPNPFNSSTTINYVIPSTSNVELKLYDLLGRKISTLINKEQTAGEHKVRFDASSLPSGVYLYTIQAGSFRDSKKLLLLK